MNQLKITKIIDAKVADFTTGAINVAGAKKISLVCKRSSHSAGSTVFSVTVSVDGDNFITYNGIVDNITNTNTQTVTRVASKTLNSDSTVIISLDMEYFCFQFIKVTADWTTDGTNDVWLAYES